MCKNKRIALITGGAGGIGSKISERLAEQNIKVVISGQNKEKALPLIEKIHHNGGDADFIQLTLENPEMINETIDELLRTYETIDILVNNAGVSGYMGPIAETPREILLRTFDINCFAAFHLSSLLLPSMVKNRYGRFIHISSLASRVFPENAATYSMSKAALNALSISLSRENARFGITSNVIAPGLVMTERIIHERIPGMAQKLKISEEEMKNKLVSDSDTHELTQPEQIADTVLFLLSSAADNITGEMLTLSGGC